MACSNTFAAEEHVTGDWHTFTFHMAGVDNCSPILQHIREHFIPLEPMHKYLTAGDVWNSDLEYDITSEVKHVLGQGLSFYVALKNSDRIVAVNLITDSRNPACFEPKSQVTKIISGIIERAKEAVNVLPELDYYADFCVTSVDTAYQGHGLATEMYRRSLTFLKAKGFPAIQTHLSHPGTQRIGEKLGFDVLHKFYLYDQVDDEHEQGDKIFPYASENESVVHVVKRL